MEMEVLIHTQWYKASPSSWEKHECFCHVYLDMYCKDGQNNYYQCVIDLPYCLQKKKEREAAILKNSKLTPDQRTKWLTVTKKEYMSSEESGEDDTITVHPIPWQSDYVSKMFNKIDSFIVRKKSCQARRQMKERKIGTPSNRTPPGSDAPEWAIVHTAH